MTTITIDDTRVHVQRDSGTGVERITHHCATRRVAQILAAELELRAAGWTISGPSSTDGFRRPLLLPGESMGAVLDGSRSDERAQGFTASRRGTDRITVDACAGMLPLVLAEIGDTADARRVIEWHLGALQ